MTAMPPTTGHLQLIQFAEKLAGYGYVHVLINTQPHEPFGEERAKALREATEDMGVFFHHISYTLEQNPHSNGFWHMWKGIMLGMGAKPGDIVVSSEAYGKRLAEEIEGVFFPYDIDRAINYAKATQVREDPLTYFNQIIPEFQKTLKTTVTIFGAESTGKTTLSRQLADHLPSWWLFEYARPYLENTSNEINVDSMTAIWYGQRALQEHAQDNLHDKPLILQDTDLFSTVGYWDFPHWDSLGDPPEELVADALRLRSDLYIVTRSNIPFEQDPLRYGGDVREGTDEYWIEILERYELPYVVLDAVDMRERLMEALGYAWGKTRDKASVMYYDRKGW